MGTLMYQKPVLQRHRGNRPGIGSGSRGDSLGDRAFCLSEMTLPLGREPQDRMDETVPGWCPQPHVYTVCVQRDLSAQQEKPRPILLLLISPSTEFF